MTGEGRPAGRGPPAAVGGAHALRRHRSPDLLPDRCRGPATAIGLDSHHPLHNACPAVEDRLLCMTGAARKRRRGPHLPVRPPSPEAVEPRAACASCLEGEPVTRLDERALVAAGALRGASLPRVTPPPSRTRPIPRRTLRDRTSGQAGTHCCRSPVAGVSAPDSDSSCAAHDGPPHDRTRVHRYRRTTGPSPVGRGPSWTRGVGLSCARSARRSTRTAAHRWWRGAPRRR